MVVVPEYRGRRIEVNGRLRRAGRAVSGKQRPAGRSEGYMQTPAIPFQVRPALSHSLFVVYDRGDAPGYDELIINLNTAWIR